MSRNNKDEEALLAKIKAKRKILADYLVKSEPRQSRLINFSIVTGALAAALTAGPGIGGNGFVDSFKNIMSFGVPIWQVLCLIATALSVAAVVINGVLKSDDMSAKIISTRNCDAKLEGLETMLELGQVSVEQAAPVYTQYLNEIPHL
jgi:hypothetical protein